MAKPRKPSKPKTKGEQPVPLMLPWSSFELLVSISKLTDRHPSDIVEQLILGLAQQVFRDKMPKLRGQPPLLAKLRELPAFKEALNQTLPDRSAKRSATRLVKQRKPPRITLK